MIEQIEQAFDPGLDVFDRRFSPDGPVVTVTVRWPGLDGKKEFSTRVVFDGTPEDFRAAMRAVEARVVKEASVPQRPCGYPGPWYREE